MSVTDKKSYENHLTEQALAYLATGVIITISHHFHNYPVVVFFGHLLIAVSFLILISIIFNYKWMRRISSPFEIFSGTTLIITFAVDIIIFIVDELVYYEGLKLLSQNLIDSLFITIVIAVSLWVLLLMLPLLLRAFNRKLSFRIKLPSFILISALLPLIGNLFLKLFPLQNILIIELALIIVIIFIVQKDKFPKCKRTLIYFSHLFLMLVPAFILGGILSYFSKASSYSLFFIFSLISLFASIIFILLLNHWRRKLFNVLRKCITITKSKLITIINKIKNITKLGITRLFSILIRVKDNVFKTFQIMLNIVNIWVKRLREKQQEQRRQK